MNSLRMVGRICLVVLFALVVLTAQASSQSPEQYPPSPSQYEPAAVSPEATDYADDIPAHIAIVDGAATIERDGRVETAEENIMLLAGDRLRTERGRVEVLFADGSALDLDHHTRVDLLSDSLVRLLDGRIRLTIARTTNAIDYRVDAAPGSVGIRTAGDYRIALGGNRSGEQELDVTVLRGSAELRNALGLTLVRAGTHAAVTASMAPSLPYIANSASWDEFDRWAEDQRDARYGVESVRYLPEEIRSYGGAFDRSGSWDYLPTYGYVWYPRVNAGWQPYHHGRWSFGARFGWFWVGFDRSWGWPTHHYGRWGFGSNRWYWIPGRRWSPAWVSWAYAPGYVSWCPLGFDNRPVISFRNGFGRQPWSGWTVIPARSFAPNILVARHAVSAQSIAPSTWSQFTARPNAPVAPAGGVARAQPLRAPTRAYAVPRGSTGAPAFDSGSAFSTTGAGAGGRPSTASAPSRLPSRVPQSRASGSTPRDVRTTPPPVAPASPERAVPRAAVPSNESPRPESNGSPSRAFRSTPRNSTPDEPNGFDRGTSGLPRNYSPAPRVVTPDRGYRSRVPETQRTTPSQAAPEPERVQPRGQPWAPRNYSPEPRPSSPDSGGFSRVPRNASPEPRSSGSDGGSSGGDRGFRSRVPEPQQQQPSSSPRSFGSPRSEPRTAPPPQEAPQRSAPPSRSAPPDSGRGSGQAVRRGRG
ncbi:MAG TPA: DUF6600 domain-containing protein [Vicinamibacterales bacterium]|nr:DUF6600 domain-containing protein [Vicinamibacterales bacterium]